MVTYINQNNSIDTVYELFIVLAIALFAMIFLCKIGAFIDSLPVREPKKKKVKEVKEVKVEKVKEVKKEEKVVVDKNATSVVAKEKESEQKISANVSATASSSGAYPYVNNTPIIIHQYTNPNDPYQSGYGYTGGYAGGYQSNYLYDRFVDRPTSDDYIQERKISEAFMSENELNAVKNRDVKIQVNDSSLDSDKSRLYSRINQMTSSNLETRERLLKEFEGLSKEMKLLLIDNIIQKM